MKFDAIMWNSDAEPYKSLKILDHDYRLYIQRNDVNKIIFAKSS